MLSKKALMHANLTALRHPGHLRAFSTAAESKVLLQNHNQRVFEFVLNFPKALNSLDIEMMQIICGQLKQWKLQPETAPKVVMMSGAGGKAFCAGGDIVSLYKSEKGENDPMVKKTFFANEYLCDYSLTQMAPIQVALWNGIVMGGGVGLSCHSPIRVATDNTLYAMPETGIGFFTDVGGSYFLSRVKNNISLGLYLGITGHRIKGRDLVKWGIATHYVPQDKLDVLRQDITSSVTDAMTVKDVSQIVDKHADSSAHEGEIENLAEIESIFKDDSVHAIFDRLNKSDTEFANRIKKLTAGLCPASIAVVFEQIHRGKDMDLLSVFEMEYKISQGFMNHPDFFEGVRALLVDKDKNPKWVHKSIADVKPEDVRFFFDRSETTNWDIAKY